MRSTIHEMRNQLTVSVANIEAFIDGKLPPTNERLRAVLNALRRLDVLMNELQPAAPLVQPAPHMKRVDLRALILRETIAIEATAQAAGVRLKVDRRALEHARCSAFVCDPDQVGQVLTNVLLNAIKYSGRGGVVTLYCHREPGVLALEISDSGPGVAPAERHTIFASGVRGSAAPWVPGSGVGLAVVQGIVEAHGGTVSVAESGSGGAVFTIRLPGIASVSSARLSPGDRSSAVHESPTPIA
jgi:signal transduction histidine kinase